MNGGNVKLLLLHLEVEVALGAGPVTVGVEGVPGQEVTLLARLTQDAGHVGAQLTGVPAPLTAAVKIPLRPQLPPPLVCAEV